MTRRATVQLAVMLSFVATIGYSIEDSTPESDGMEAKSVAVADQVPSTADERDASSGSQLRLREGAKLVNQVGELHEAGGVIAFYPDGETHSLQLLQNLALERVGRDLDQTHRKWSVTGIVTEYKGSNYLLLQRAVLKARVTR